MRSHPPSRARARFALVAVAGLTQARAAERVDVPDCDGTAAVVERLDDPDAGVRFWAARILTAAPGACFAVPALARAAADRETGIEPLSPENVQALNGVPERDQIIFTQSLAGNV